MNIRYLPTPALVLDKKTFDANRAAMRELLAGSSLALRPHFKSHKCAAIAKMQIEDGAIGMTCAKLSEAEDLVLSGVEDVLIANQITEPDKIMRLAYLARAAHITVCVDHAANVRALSRACVFAGSKLSLLIEYDLGMERCGVTSPKEVLSLAVFIRSLEGLEYAGVQAYAGHISHVVDEKERLSATEENERKLRALIASLDEMGFAPRIISGGSTGTAAIKAKAGLYTELQAGSYLFMDATYRDLALPFKNSLFVLATVISVNGDIAVVDAGVKSCGVDQGMPVPVGFSVEKIVASEEHFQLHKPTKPLRVGDRVLLVPGHCCSTVNLHNEIFLADGERVVDRIPVTARGGFR